MKETYEPKRAFRWTFIAEGLDSFRLHSMELENIPHTEKYTLTIRMQATEKTDMLECPVQYAGKGRLKFLNPAGDDIDIYELMWDGVVHLPFESLRYDDSGSAMTVTRLTVVHMRRVSLKGRDDGSTRTD